MSSCICGSNDSSKMSQKSTINLILLTFYLFMGLVLIIRPCYGINYENQFGTENWTSCDQFVANNTFDYNSIVNIDWKIFYFWNKEREKTYNIRFSHATPILVDRFKVGLEYTNSTLDWSKAVLFMETSIDFSALYITTDKPGIFRLIPSLAFRMDTIPLLIFGLKIVDPGYLGIMNCQFRFCYALAPVDRMPKKEYLRVAAEKMGFRGDFNRSYLYKREKFRVPLPDLDDSLEDETIDIENEIGFQH